MGHPQGGARKGSLPPGKAEGKSWLLHSFFRSLCTSSVLSPARPGVGAGGCTCASSLREPWPNHGRVVREAPGTKGVGCPCWGKRGQTPESQ